MQDYFGQKMAEEQRARQLAEQRDYEYNDWLRRNQMQGQQADERWQRQFDATHTTLPFQGGSMVAPVEMAVPNSSLFNLMTRKAEQPSQPVSYGEPYSVDLGNGKVAWFKDPSDGGKPVKLGESQPKGGGGDGGAGGVRQPTAAQAHGMFVDAWGEPDTYRRSKWDENDNLIVQEVPIPPVGTRFNGDDYAGFADSVPGAGVASADSLYSLGGITPQEAIDRSFDIHQPRLERASEKSANIDSVYSALEKFNITDENGDGTWERGGGSSPMWPFGSSRREMSDKQLVDWIGKNQTELGVSKKALVDFIESGLGIENPLEYLSGSAEPKFKEPESADEFVDQLMSQIGGGM